MFTCMEYDIELRDTFVLNIPSNYKALTVIGNKLHVAADTETPLVEVQFRLAAPGGPIEGGDYIGPVVLDHGNRLFHLFQVLPVELPLQGYTVVPLSNSEEIAAPVEAEVHVEDAPVEEGVPAGVSEVVATAINKHKRPTKKGGASS